ncbi:DUF3486 family protein [Algimonas porphyrae]
MVLLNDAERAELDRRIKENGFGGYRTLAAWLQERGYEISKSSVHAYGQELEQQCKKIRIATEQADYIRRMFPDDDAGMMDGVLRTFVAELFSYMQDFSIEKGSMDPTKMGKLIGDLSRATVSQKKLQAQIREEERQLAAEAARDAVSEQGVSAEIADMIYRQVLGVDRPALEAPST